MSALEKLPSFTSAVRTFLSTRNLSLCNSKSRLGHSVVARIFNLTAVTQCREVSESDINADLLGAIGQRNALHFYAETGVPLSSLAFDRQCLNLAFNRTVQLDLDAANLRQFQVLAFDGKAKLRIGQRIIASTSAETRKASLLPAPHGAEQSLERSIYAVQCVLQHRPIDIAKFSTLNFDFWQLIRLRTKTNRLAFKAVGISTLLQSSVVQLAAQRKLTLKNDRLIPCGVQTLLKRFSGFRHTALSLRAERRQPWKRSSCLSRALAVSTSTSETFPASSERRHPSIASPSDESQTADQPQRVAVHGLALSPSRSLSTRLSLHSLRTICAD